MYSLCMIFMILVSLENVKSNSDVSGTKNPGTGQITARPVSQKLKIEFRFFSSKQSRVIGKHGFQSIFAFYLPKTQILGTRIITNGLYLLSNNASSKQKIGILDKFLR